MSEVKSGSPSFSIVIPAKNESLLLPACLDSLNAQNYSGLYEVIVVDNDSSDNTATVAANLGAVVVFEKRHGVCAARQKGFESSQYDVVVSTDADSTFEPDWLRNMSEVFMREPETVALGGPVSFVDAPVWAQVYPRLLFGLNSWVARLRGRPFYLSACNLAFKRTAFDGYNIELTQGGDEFYVLKQLRAKGKISFHNSNSVATSARRLNKGFLYSLFVTFLTFYLLEYFLSRFTKRSVFGSFPEFRGRATPRTKLVWRMAVSCVLAFSFAIVPATNAFAHASARVVRSEVRRAIHRIT